MARPSTNCNLSGLPGLAHDMRASPVCKHCLLKLNLRTSLFQLRLDFRGFVLVDRLFDRLGSPFDQVLGFLEPKARDRAHFLDHLDLLSPAAASTTVNSVCSSAAAAETPHLSSRSFASSAASSTVRPERSSTIFCRSAITLVLRF